MARLRSDHVFGVTDAALTDSATTLSSLALARLPAVVAPDYAALTLRDPVAGTYEIVHVTAHTAAATTATILRARESSAAAAWASGTAWLHGPTVQDFVEGGLQARTTATITTDSLAPGALETGLVTLAAGYRLVAVQTSVPARVRLYTTTAKRTADLGRAVGVVPQPGDGCVFEHVTTADALSAPLNPIVDGATPDGATAVPYAVTNTNTAGTQAVTVTLTYVRTE